MNQDPNVPQNDLPIWIPEKGRKKKPYACKYEKLLSDTYRKHEIIVFFETAPSQEDIKKTKESFRIEGIDPETISTRECDNCNLHIQLWKATNIHTVISAKGVKAGSGPVVPTVGESYSLNFFNRIPQDPANNLEKYKSNRDKPYEKKEKIIVAVLDTGIDTTLVDQSYIWQDANQQTASPCYKDVSTGWNFLNETPDINDDNPGRHGSIVAQYIINEFEKSPVNSVQVMPLKTHNSDGIGNLFEIICAIHFAITKGANIINASWGFYNYSKEPVPYLKELITETLPKNGILFITASGNKFDEADEIAKILYYEKHNPTHISPEQLRNLVIHNFYPAILSGDKNNVITVSTTDTEIISHSQNYSNEYVDLGVIADDVTPGNMRFIVPFPGALPDDLVGGSSFATAIATGIIGAFCERSLYKAGVTKTDVFTHLSSISGRGSIPVLLNSAEPLAKKYIKKGLYTQKNR